jgi:hypothetical protein
MNSKRLKARRAAQAIRKLANENDNESEARTHTAEDAALAVDQLAQDNEVEIQGERRKHMDEFTRALKENTAALIELQRQFAVHIAEGNLAIKQIEEVDCIVRGKNKDDGMMTDMVLLKNSVASFNGFVKTVIVPILIALVIAIGGFVWAIATHAVTIVK